MVRAAVRTTVRVRPGKNRPEPLRRNGFRESANADIYP